MAKRTMRGLVFISVLLTLTVWSGVASAKDVAGRIGLGMDNTLTASTIGNIPSSPSSNNAPSFGLSLKYWINNDWGIGGVLGFGYGSNAASSDGYGDPEGFWAFSLDLKGLYNFVKSETANVAVFLTLHLQKENTTLRRPAGPQGSNLGFAFAFGLTPEIFLTEDFALAAELGLIFRVQEGFATGFSGDNVLGGLGFHYYF
jgi:hypothetical protein